VRACLSSPLVLLLDMNFGALIDLNFKTCGFSTHKNLTIIGAGDFSVTNVDNKTILSFRIPSVKEIDYVAEASRQNEQLQSHGKESKAKIRAKRKKERKNRKKS